MVRIRCRSRPTSTAILVLLLAVGALARAEPDGAVPSRQQEPEALPPIEVTAPRLDTQDVPASITSVPAASLVDGETHTTRDVAVRAANVTTGDAGDRRTGFYAIRGLQNDIFGEASVGMYVDGIPYPDSRAAALDVFDVERVDVYRGPQNLAFGRAAETGALNIVTRPPTETYTVRGRMEYGNYDSQVYEAAASGPLGTKGVLFSLAGLRTTSDGYVRNTFLHRPLGSRDDFSGRARLLLRPAPRLQITLTGQGQRADEGGQVLTALDAPDPFKVAYNTPGKERTSATLGAGELTYEWDTVRLHALASRLDFNTGDSETDLDLTPAPVLVLLDDHAFVDWNGELRLASTRPDARWRWQLGTYVEDKSTDIDLGIRADSTSFIEAPPPQGLGLAFTAPVRNDQAAALHGRTYAGFGEVSLDVTDRLELRTGLRYEDQTITMDRRHVLVAPVQHAAVPVVPALHLSSDTRAWLPQTSLAYRVDPHLLPYVAVARGYKPAAFSHAADEPALARFAPEYAWSFETGVRSSWLDDRVTADASVFDVLVHDYQVRRNVGLSSITLLNARHATSRGVELEAAARPARGLDLGLAFGWDDARYDTFLDPSARQRFDGNRIQRIPRYTLSVFTAYRHRSGASARVDYREIGDYPYLEDNLRTQSAYGLLDARVGWEGARVGAWVYGRNMLDATYFPGAVRNGGRYLAFLGLPRTFGVMVAARF